MTLAVSSLGREALDAPGAPREIVEATLRDIARVNTWLGGRAAAAFGMERLLAGGDQGRALTLLDVGAGCGDIAGYLAVRAARHGVKLARVAADPHPVAAQLCRRAGLTTLRCDGGLLPLAAGSVDIALASQLLHHLSRDAATDLLQELDRVARVGVIVADLRRHTMAALGIWLASYAMRLHPVTRQDGVTSVRRGFTAGELHDLLGRAGVGGAVYQRPGYRLVAVWRKRRAHG